MAVVEVEVVMEDVAAVVEVVVDLQAPTLPPWVEADVGKC